jgi:hypothetical protein
MYSFGVCTEQGTCSQVSEARRPRMSYCTRPELECVCAARTGYECHRCCIDESTHECTPTIVSVNSGTHTREVKCAEPCARVRAVFRMQLVRRCIEVWVRRVTIHSACARQTASARRWVCHIRRTGACAYPKHRTSNMSNSPCGDKTNECVCSPGSPYECHMCCLDTSGQCSPVTVVVELLLVTSFLE